MESTLDTEHTKRRTSTFLLLPFVGILCSLCSGCALFVGSNILKAPTVAISANPASVAVGQTSILTVVATDATQLTVTGSDGSAYYTNDHYDNFFRLR